MSREGITQDKLKKLRYPRSLDGRVVDVFFHGDHIWLSQKQISNLFGVQILTVRKHLRNAYKKGKLIEEKVSFKMKRSADDTGDPKRVYSLEAIENVGHRINSSYVIKFNEWLEQRKASSAKDTAE